ncbi:MAG: DUF2293 domain-containing protein [Planctomycetaceae bacterium]
MPEMIFRPGPKVGMVRQQDGTVVPVPPGWDFFPPGDPALTRRVKAAGEYWLLQEKRGRKVFSRGIWAPKETIDSIRAALVEERADPSYAKRQHASAQRREKEQTAYVEDFGAAVFNFLNFHPDHTELALRMAEAVATHATPVGSGTVARTKRIPIEERAEAAVIAWMRHQTTGYDSMSIARIKGERREVRRALAKRSHELLEIYRSSNSTPHNCPLRAALES